MNGESAVIIPACSVMDSVRDVVVKIPIAMNDVWGNFAHVKTQIVPTVYKAVGSQTSSQLCVRKVQIATQCVRMARVSGNTRLQKTVQTARL